MLTVKLRGGREGEGRVAMGSFFNRWDQILHAWIRVLDVVRFDLSSSISLSPSEKRIAASVLCTWCSKAVDGNKF